ncbi:MAG: DegT/DnrJ/EryC1/StrS aminotransferase family protein [Candidatus Omnitrophota bacterium]
MFKEIPPTAGFPLYSKDFLPLITGRTRQGPLEDDFKGYLDVPYARITCSGTAAFYLILESLKTISRRKTVVIPSFVCPLVPLAIKRAGLNAIVCDINRDNFNFDNQQLRDLCSRNPDILAIVAVHLGGVPLDFEAIQQAAKEAGAFIIEDCAQSLGAEHKGKKVGTLGEFSFFSLCRGKGLTIYEGGLITAKEKGHCAIINATIERLVNDDLVSESIKILELFGYWLFYRPQLFWTVFRLPQIFWNWQGQPLRAQTEYFTADFPVHKVSRIRESIGRAVLPRLDQEINKQRQKAFDYMERLKDIPGIKLITEAPGDLATYPYLTLLFNEPARRREALNTFINSGLGVSQIYVSAITDYDYLSGIIGNKACPNGRYLAERQISLTTSTFLKNKDIATIVEMIKKL